MTNLNADFWSLNKKCPSLFLARSILLVAVLAVTGLFVATASATPVAFTFDCTISGAAPGTNNCDQGPDIAKLTIAETTTPGVLSLSILRLLAEPQGGGDDLELQAIHLNFAGDYGSLPPKPSNPNENVPTIQYSTTIDFAPFETILVEDDATTALNYKGFDLQLCNTGVGSCDVAVTFTDTIFGYIRSGNAYDLTPEMFDALTEDAGNANNPDRARTFDGCEVSLTHLRAAVKIVEATSPQNDRCSNSGNANGYGPYYGAIGPMGGSPPSGGVPTPGTLLLLSSTLIGFGAWRRLRS